MDDLIALLEEHRIRYCLIGGQAVNAYADPLVSLDLDLVVAVDQLPLAEELFRVRFHLERFAHSLNLSAPGSSLRVQIQTDPRYAHFSERASVREVLGLRASVAVTEDVLQGDLGGAWRRAPSEQAAQRSPGH